MRRLIGTMFFVSVVLCIANGVHAQTNFTVSVSKIMYAYKHPSIPDGMFTITFTPGSQRTYLNIGATNMSTQQFGIIVSNMPLPSSSDVSGPVTMMTRFDFSKISAPPYAAFFALTVYIHILTSPGFYPFDPSTFKDQKIITVPQIKDDAKGSEGDVATDPPIAPVLKPNQSLGDSLADYQYRPDAPNLDLDSSAHGISPTYAGDLNACVPTATANSIKWAQLKYTDVNLPSDMDLRKTEMTLSGLMKRPSGQGTLTRDMISGKLDFIEQFKLPMEVKYQSTLVSNPVGVGSTSGKSIGRSFNLKTPNPKPTWDFLKRMMKNGEDVEMNFKWYDTTDRRWYAHSVNVTGFSESQAGIKWISFKHDVNQEGPGGTGEEAHQVTVDANGWMRFGQTNENFIRDVVVESPVIQEGREAAAWLNELFTDAPLRKASSDLANSPFVEVALKNTAADLSNYTVTLYDGKTGASYASYTLDKFTVGSASNGLVTYFMNVPGLLGPPAGVAISHTGVVIQNQFISYGGSFIAADGDATGLTSTDIGMIPTSASVQMNGSGTAFSQFGITYGVPSPGTINQDETYTASNLSKPGSLSPNNGDRNKTGPVTMMWSKVPGATNYELQVSTDPYFLTTAVLDNATLTDTTYIFANANLEGSRLYWRARGLSSGVKSGFSTSRYFSDKLNAPTNLFAAQVQSKVGLTWQNNSTRSKGVYVQRKAGDASSSNQFQTIDSVTSNTYTDQTVQAGASVSYRVYVFNDVAESDFSNVQTVTMTTAPQAPALFAPADSAKNLPLSPSLSWNAVAGAASYHLQLSDRADFATITVDDTTLTATARAVGPLTLATTYYWRVRGKNDGGYGPFSPGRQFSTIRTTSVERLDDGIPTAFGLSQNYPNPFNPATTIQFALPKASYVTLKVFDLLGREVSTLLSQELEAGYFTLRWQANVASGIYYYRLHAGDFVDTKRMILLK